MSFKNEVINEEFWENVIKEERAASFIGFASLS
jgi:hypothetical protein